MACWAQSRSAQVMDDRLQPPDGPTSVQKASRSKSGGETGTAQDPRRGKKSNTHHRGVSRPPAALVEEPKTEAPPPPPPTLAQQPPNAPQVSYRNGMLTVTANNSTLGDILSQVRSKTGANIEFPASLSQERVAAVVGPAPAPQVLANLLNGTRFDYILLGMNGRPDLLQRAIITQRQGGAPTAAVAGTPTSAPQARPAMPPPTPADEEPEAPPEETVEQPEEAPPPQPVQSQPMQPQPGMQPAPNQPYPVPQQPGPQQPGTQQPKTPEQLLQELQRMQQQQQQQQQQQPPQ